MGDPPIDFDRPVYCNRLSAPAGFPSHCQIGPSPGMDKPSRMNNHFPLPSWRIRFTWKGLARPDWGVREPCGRWQTIVRPPLVFSFGRILCFVPNASGIVLDECLSKPKHLNRTDPVKPGLAISGRPCERFSNLQPFGSTSGEKAVKARRVGTWAAKHALWSRSKRNRRVWCCSSGDGMAQKSANAKHSGGTTQTCTSFTASLVSGFSSNVSSGNRRPSLAE